MVWSLRDLACPMQVAHTLPGHSAYVVSLHFAAEGTRLIAGAMGGSLHLWDTRDWVVRHVASGHMKSVNAMALNRTGDRLATGGSDCDVCIWTFPDFDLLHRLRDRKQVVSALTASHNGTCFAIGSYGGRVALWDFAGQPICGFKAQARNLSVVAFAPGDASLWVGGLGGALADWSLPDAVKMGSREVHEIAISACQCLPDVGQLLTLGYGGTLKLWDSDNWTLIRSQPLCTDRITGFCVDAARKRALVLSRGRVRIFSLESWIYVDECAVNAKVLPCGAFAPDGRSAVVASADRTLHILALD